MALDNRLQDCKYRNWVKASLGLENLKQGLTAFVTDQATHVHSTFIASIEQKCNITNVQCSACQLNTLLPAHVANNTHCPHGGKCCCFRRHKIPCTKGICGELYDTIVSEHNLNNPIWNNTESLKWTASPWELAKCYLSSRGYKDKHTADECDASGLLSVCINCRTIRSIITDISQFEQARTARNEILHQSLFELEDATFANHIGVMLAVLNDPIIQQQPDAAVAVTHLQELLKDERIINKDDETKARDTALAAVKTELDQLKATDIQRKNELEQIKSDIIKNKGNHDVVLKTLERHAADIKVLYSRQDPTDKRQTDLHARQDTLENSLVDISKRQDVIETRQVNTEKHYAEVGTHLDNIRKRQYSTEKHHDELGKRLDDIGERQDDTEKPHDEIGKRKRLDVIENRQDDTETHRVERGNRSDESTRTHLKAGTFTITSTDVAAAQEEARTMPDETKQYNNLKEVFSEDLKTFYRQRHQSMPISPLMPTVDADVVKFYVAPKLTYITRNMDNSMKHFFGVADIGEKVTTYRDIFYSDGRNAKNIYIQGEPGTGKSTLCVQMASVWCDTRENVASRKNEEDSISPDGAEHFDDKQVLQEFDFLFLITLRQALEKDCDIENMIKNHIIIEMASHGKYDDDFVARILDEENCLIIMDGLDEWSHPDNSCQRNLKSIPHRKIWKNCTYVTTTRPWKMNSIDVKDSDVDSQIEISGLESPTLMTHKVIDCLNNKYPKSQKNPADFEHQLTNRSLQHFVEIPILLMQLICVWFQDQTLGASKCEIYSHMIDMMFERAHRFFTNLDVLRKHTGDVTLPYCFRNSKRCNEQKHFLKYLSKLAFNTLLSHDRASTIVFDEAILVKHLSKVEQDLALKTGILSKHKPLMSLTCPRYAYYFLHKTLQEFLAALYMTMNPSKEILQQVLEVYNSHMNVFDISEIFVYVCGMDPKMARKLSKEVTMKMEVIMKKTIMVGSFQQMYDTCMPYQSMILDGYSEGINNNHKSINLAFQHASNDYHNISISDRKNLTRLMDMNAGKLLTYFARNNVPIEEIQHEITRNKRLSWVFFIDITSSGHVTVDLSHHDHLKLLYLCRVKGVNITISTNLTLCVLESLSSELEGSMLTQLPQSAKRLEVLIVLECNNIDLLLRVVPSLPELQTLGIARTVLEDSDIILTNSVHYVDLYKVSMSSRSCRKLVELLTQIPHPVSCRLDECKVTPVEEFDTLKQYVSESHSCNVTEKENEKFYFKTASSQ